MIGQLADQRYRVVSILGSGGFGCTYLAHDTRRPGEPVCVVKELAPSSDDPKVLQIARRLFSSEAATLEKLGSHDQIPRLLAYFEENGGFYLVQEFVDGITLDRELAQGDIWGTDRVLELLQQVLEVLAFVHSHKVIHRDVKPANIMRRSHDRKLVLLDFGAVKEIRQATTSSITGANTGSKTVAIGTVGYASPEQLQGKPRESSDVYALGVIAIQALTGEQPQEFLEDEMGEIFWQAPDLPPEIYRIIRKMVKRNYRERYNSALDALADLQPFLDQQREQLSAPTAIFFPDQQETLLDTIPEPEPEEVSKADILLVDDKPENLRLLSTMLEEQGYEIREAINGTLALKSAQADPPDLILLDINMPGLNGYEVCQRLKADQTTNHVPVIFVSAQDEAWDKVKAFSVGGVDYITKPFKVMEVLARIETHLRLGKLQKRLYETQNQLRLEVQKRQNLEAALDQARKEISLLKQQ
ncbi:MAG: response regulator [Cyanobacteria bacterium KgW148]|nr:response regulator [Cyanobacteria bacterium KgW148]